MNHTIKDKDAKGDNISTVGVDIGDYVIQRNGEKIVFSTWDFGGQVTRRRFIISNLFSINRYILNSDNSIFEIYLV